MVGDARRHEVAVAIPAPVDVLAYTSKINMLLKGYLWQQVNWAAI